VVGWIPFFNTTEALYDMHLESNNQYKADCTHYIYSPYLFLPLWLDTIRVMEDFIPRNKRRQKEITQTFFDRIYSAESNVVLKGSSKALYLVQNRTKRLFLDWNKFLALGYTSVDVEQVSDTVLGLLADGEPVI